MSRVLMRYTMYVNETHRSAMLSLCISFRKTRTPRLSPRPRPNSSSAMRARSWRRTRYYFASLKSSTTRDRPNLRRWSEIFYAVMCVANADTRCTCFNAM